MHKHSAKQDPNGVYTLFRDEIACGCPKMMFPQIIPHQKSAMSPTEYITQLNQLPCTTKCPFAQMSVQDKVVPTKTNSSVIDGKQNVYTISCEGRVNAIVLDEVVPADKPKSALTIAEK